MRAPVGWKAGFIRRGRIPAPSERGTKNSTIRTPIQEASETFEGRCWVLEWPHTVSESTLVTVMVLRVRVVVSIIWTHEGQPSLTSDVKVQCWGTGQINEKSVSLLSLLLVVLTEFAAGGCGEGNGIRGTNITCLGRRRSIEISTWYLYGERSEPANRTTQKVPSNYGQHHEESSQWLVKKMLVHSAMLTLILSRVSCSEGMFPYFISTRSTTKIQGEIGSPFSLIYSTDYQLQ